jgi:4-hydroxy 2-oxovalerate aldolase
MEKEKIGNLAKPIILDVTLRDGGYLNNWAFDEFHIFKAIKEAFSHGADIVEIGYSDDKYGLPITAAWKPKDLDRIQSIKEHKSLALMCRPTVENAGNVIQTRKEFIDLIRIPTDLRYPSLANNLADKCLKHQVLCSFNITNISCYNDDQIYQAFSKLSDQVSIVYIADSRGALLPSRVKEIFSILQTVRHCQWGYHAHNNLGLAVETTQAALECGVDFIDGSILGIGLGGRNLDLLAALNLALSSRPELTKFKFPYSLNEYSLGVDPPGEELEMYRLTGIKNFKMEWAMMMQECLGLKQACELIKQAPDYPLFVPEEYKSYVSEEIWKKLRW